MIRRYEFRPRIGAFLFDNALIGIGSPFGYSWSDPQKGQVFLLNATKISASADFLRFCRACKEINHLIKLIPHLAG